MRGADTGFREAEGLSGRQSLFGIVQGAGHLPLRRESLDKTVEIGFDGYAIGGLSVGEEKPVMYEVLEFLAPQMPADAPRYLMGVGTPEDLVEAVYRGVDMFDCVMPTRNGRTGGAFTSRGKLNIRNAKFTQRRHPARRRMRLLRLPEIFQELSAAPLPGRRNARARTYFAPQSRVLP